MAQNTRNKEELNKTQPRDLSFSVQENSVRQREMPGLANPTSSGGGVAQPTSFSGGSVQIQPTSSSIRLTSSSAPTTGGYAQGQPSPSGFAPTGDLDKDIQNAYEAYRNFLRENADAYYRNQEGMIDTALQEQLARLEKAYQEAVMRGEMSEQEAIEQYEEQVRAINKHAYENSQITNLAGESRGISNSQQMLALMQGDQRHAQNLRNANVKARDKRINEIRDRIAQITNEYNLDVNLAHTTAENALRQAQAQADMMFNTGMSELNMMQYHSYLQTKQNLTIEEQRHLNILEQMARNQEYTRENMRTQHKYTQENMRLQQQFTRENMNLQHELDLAKMRTQHGYDMEKINVSFQNDLKKLAKQYGYEKQLSDRRHSQALTEIQKRQEAAIKEAEQMYKMERDRLYASYHNKNSKEFKIREAQLKEAEEKMINEIYTNSIIDSMNALGNEHWGWETWINDPGAVLNNPSYYMQPTDPSAPTPSTNDGGGWLKSIGRWLGSYKGGMLVNW